MREMPEGVAENVNAMNRDKENRRKRRSRSELLEFAARPYPIRNYGNWEAW
jgi:hypothetical protein